MKFLINPFIIDIIENDSLDKMFRWIEFQYDFNDSIIVRCLSGICLIIMFIPLILWILFILNFEFFMSKLIFRHRTLIISNITQQIKFKHEIQPWLESSLPYYAWTYFKIDSDLPVLFKNRLYNDQVLEIRFLTNDQHLMFKLVWGGEFTQLI